jgi:hypothetical protein
MCCSSVAVLLDAGARLNQAFEQRPAEEERRGYEAKEPSTDHIALTQGERSWVVPHDSLRNGGAEPSEVRSVATDYTLAPAPH